MAKLTNSGDYDQTPQNAASDLDLHCLPITLLWVSRLQWVNKSSKTEKVFADIRGKILMNWSQIICAHIGFAFCPILFITWGKLILLKYILHFKTEFSKISALKMVVGILYLPCPSFCPSFPSFHNSLSLSFFF